MHSDKMKNQPLKGAEGSLSSSDFLEGESDAAKQLYNYVKLVSPTNMSVLINGASGTGKEYVAHRIHQLSKRADRPFVAIDCGSIPKELAASEFFGHIKGAFTGALTDKTGAFVEANGGTIFLDEIGNLSYEVQIQLLRALQERKIRPVGSNKEISVDIRLVSATNENLEQAIEKERSVRIYITVSMNSPCACRNSKTAVKTSCSLPISFWTRPTAKWTSN